MHTFPVIYLSSSIYEGNSSHLRLLSLHCGLGILYLVDHYSILMATCGSTRCNEDILKCVQVLVEKNVDVNAFDRHHMSALLYASRVGRPKVVQKLLDHGSNIDKQDNRGYTVSKSLSTFLEKFNYIVMYTRSSN